VPLKRETILKGDINVKQFSRLLVFSCLHFFLLSLHADQKGSDTVVSIQDHAAFSGAINNGMLTFGYFKNGFSFADNTTTCTFNSVYPVSGMVSLNAGSVYLKSNLFFENDVDFETGGSFFANNHYIDLCATITGFNNLKQTRFDHANVYLNSDLIVSGTVKFTGDCVLDGRWNTLTLRNIEMYGIAQDNIRCADHSAKLVLDNMRWVGKGDYTFTVGSFEIYNEVNFVGPYTFKYDSPLTSTIMQDSTWYLSDIVRLELGRCQSAWSREPLCFTDKSSALRMENCTISITPSGASFTTGTLVMDREVKFDVQSTTTIGCLIFGNNNPDEDIAWILYPKAVANLTGGCFLHEIVKQENFTTNAVEVKYVLSRGGVYWAKQNISFKNVGIFCYDYGTLWLDEGIGVCFENCTMETEPVSYMFTGTFLGVC
jgi:ribonuclease HI